VDESLPLLDDFDDSEKEDSENEDSDEDEPDECDESLSLTLDHDFSEPA